MERQKLFSTLQPKSDWKRTVHELDPEQSIPEQISVMALPVYGKIRQFFWQADTPELA